jgi:hypothetical protein
LGGRRFFAYLLVFWGVVLLSALFPPLLIPECCLPLAFERLLCSMALGGVFFCLPYGLLLLGRSLLGSIGDWVQVVGGERSLCVVDDEKDSFSVQRSVYEMP